MNASTSTDHHNDPSGAGDTASVVSARRRDVHGEQGSLTPLFLMVMVGVIGGMLAFMQMGHASVLSTESNTAADASALAGAQELASQLRNLDAGVTWSALDRDRICGAAGDYASRNGATMTACDVDLHPFQVTVTVRGDSGVVSGPLEDDPENRPISRARAEVGVTFASAGGIGGGGATSQDVSRDRLGAEYQDLEAPELLEVLIGEASRIDALRLPYVWGGGHGMNPTYRNGPYDCSAAVSALLQTVYPGFPTITSGMYMGVGASGPSPSGYGLTIWAYQGHVFVTLGGRGWGTGSGHTPGAGWLTYNSPPPSHSAAVASHIPALEPQGAEQIAAVQDAMSRLYNGPGGSGGGWSGGGAGGAMLPPTVRLVPID